MISHRRSEGFFAVADFEAFRDIPDDDGDGEWDTTQFTFFSSYAWQVNMEMFRFDIEQTLYEACILVLGTDRQKQVVHQLRSRRCSYMARITALLDEHRDGSGRASGVHRDCGRSRKGRPKKNNA